ncbi:M48 family metalloprotease [bacterium]|nr:M48 family metalloprotease [bacterium]
MTVASSRQELTARGGMALAALGLPASLILAAGFGLVLMAVAGCRHMSLELGVTGGSLALLAVGGLASSFLGNLVRARRARNLADQVSIEVEDEERLRVVTRLAARLGVPAPSLRAVVSDAPYAFGVLDRPPCIVVSTWVFDHLTDPEWEALVAHELAHMRREDRLFRWLGSLFWRSLKGMPGAHRTWQQLDTAMEDAADRAAGELLGDEAALASARRKFLAAEGTGTPPAQLLKALAPAPLPVQLALASLGVVATLPLLPLVVVPLCMSFCGV